MHAKYLPLTSNYFIYIWVINGDNCKICTATRCNTSGLQQWKQNEMAGKEGEVVSVIDLRVHCADSAGEVPASPASQLSLCILLML